MDGDDTTTPGRIVVGIDGSAGCKAALGWALRQAARTGAAIEVVAAWGSPVFVSHADLWPVDVDLEAIVHRQVARVLAEVVPAGSTVPVCVTVRRTAPAVALLDAARGAECLVVGTRGHSEPTATLLGSVSLHCASRAPCPVVVVSRGSCC